MTRFRTITINQVTAKAIEPRHELLLALPVWQRALHHCDDRLVRLTVRQVADAAGGDVFEPASPSEAFVAEVMRRAKWAHPILAEVIT